MESASLLIIFMASLLVGISGYSVYTSFGPPSENLRDPFEEHED
jgi:PsbN protein